MGRVRADLFNAEQGGCSQRTDTRLAWVGLGWVGVLLRRSSVLIQYIYENLDFRSPFFLTYLATSLLSFHLPANWTHKAFRRWLAKNSSSEEAAAEHTHNYLRVRGDSGGSDNSPDENNGRKSFRSNDRLSADDLLDGSEYLPDEKEVHLVAHSSSSPRPPSMWELVKIASVIAPTWFAANCLYNYSLLMTSVSSSTIISNLSAAFTLFFSWYMGLEEVTTCKMLGVVVCFAGAVAVGLQDNESSDDDQEQTAMGDIVALLASAGYGVYTTMIRYKVPDEETISMQVLLGYIGVMNALILLPVLIILIIGKWGNVNQLTGEAFGFIALNGFTDTVAADYFWARAVVLTSPTVATIGMSITIPIALLTDFFINGISPTAISMVGSLTVILGFLLVNLGREEQQMIVDFVYSKLRPVYLRCCTRYESMDGPVRRSWCEGL